MAKSLIIIFLDEDCNKIATSWQFDTELVFFGLTLLTVLQV